MKPKQMNKARKTKNKETKKERKHRKKKERNAYKKEEIEKKRERERVERGSGQTRGKQRQTLKNIQKCPCSGETDFLLLNTKKTKKTKNTHTQQHKKNNIKKASRWSRNGDLWTKNKTRKSTDHLGGFFSCNNKKQQFLKTPIFIVL